jgi:hypothetical protein
MIEGDEVVDRLRHKRMPFFGEHEVIGNANRYRFREDNWVHEEGVEGTEAADVQIDVHAAIVVEDEIANGIGPLNRVGVGVECVKKPGIVLGYELPRTRVCPEHILAGNTVSIARKAKKAEEGGAH